MSDIVIASANVKQTDTTLAEWGASGEALLAGQMLYKSASNGKLYKASAATQASAKVVGMALDSAPGADQPVRYAWYGRVNVGVVLTQATLYVLSINAGFMAPSADLDASSGTWWGTLVGISASTSELSLSIRASEAQNP